MANVRIECIKINKNSRNMKKKIGRGLRWVSEYLYLLTSQLIIVKTKISEVSELAQVRGDFA